MSDQADFDTEALLLRMRELVETARPMPLSASVLISRDEFADLLDEALDGLPEELRRARWLLKEREEFLAEARRDADDLVEAARTRAEHMVERTEVVREANRVAQSRVNDAEAQARALRHEAEDYIDQKLAGFEVVLDRTMQAVQHGRERLSVHIEPEEEALSENGDLEADDGFFDQDEM